MFEDIHEIAENSAYLKVVEQKDVRVDILNHITPYKQCGELEARLRAEGKLEFNVVFEEPLGFYFIRQFLKTDYAEDKAIFVKDVKSYGTMRFLSARRRAAVKIFERYVSDASEEYTSKLPKEYRDKSVFAIIPVLDKSRRYSLDSDLADTRSEDAKHTRASLAMGDTNTIGVYGRTVAAVKTAIETEEAPVQLFDAVAEEVLNDLQLDMFPRFLKSAFFQEYIACKSLESMPISISDFNMFRLLGRGGFGAVHACRKDDSGALYAVKCMDKRLVKMKKATHNVMEERDVLTMIKSPFVTNLKYALQDETTLYLVMDLMLGGDLKYQLLQQKQFPEERAKFYAAEVLLGLEHVHSLNIIYRDLKLENVLLDNEGHCRISDLGLAVITRSKLKGYAGTPGYTAPEVIEKKAYGPEVDLFSYGVLVYRMLSGRKPFPGAKDDREIDKFVVSYNPQFPAEFFSPEASSLLKQLLEKSPSRRLGAGPSGIEDVKQHPFFASIDWGLLEARYVKPPFVPNQYDVNAASLKDIGDFDEAKFKNQKLNERFLREVKRFDYTNARALQEEIVASLEKRAEMGRNGGSGGSKRGSGSGDGESTGCCTII